MSEKLNITQKKTHELKSLFQNIAHLFRFCSHFLIFERLYLKELRKTKIWYFILHIEGHWISRYLIFLSPRGKRTTNHFSMRWGKQYFLSAFPRQWMQIQAPWRTVTACRTHLCRPVRSTFAVRETASLGIMGAPRVPPLNPSESIVLSEHYRLWGV